MQDETSRRVHRSSAVPFTDLLQHGTGNLGCKQNTEHTLGVIDAATESKDLPWEPRFVDAPGAGRNAESKDLPRRLQAKVTHCDWLHTAASLRTCCSPQAPRPQVSNPLKPCRPLILAWSGPVRLLAGGRQAGEAHEFARKAEGQRVPEAVLQVDPITLLARARTNESRI